MNDHRPALHVDVDVHDDQSDIYRGHPPHPSIRSPTPLSTVDSSSSSSSSSFLAGGRLGAIAAVVELAISRWARGNSSDSSSSSSSSSYSRSSVVTLSRSQRARVRRRRSAATIHSLQSERDFVAHISRLKAREESRQIPRQFTLYLPPSLSPYPKAADRDAKKQRVTCTASLSLLVPQLDAALKKATRVHRNQYRQRIPKSHAKRRMDYHDYMLPASGEPSTPTLPPAKPKAWYLDVASPTWEDMRTLGKSLHLHPLTLEDILQRDPREKLELFPKLGYYFISFRAIETETMHHRKLGAREGATALHSSGQDEGPVGEANVYLVVFNDGICSFHFTDMSEHTDRVRNRIMLLEEVVNMTSDWIAHGILDSIVDSFFPLLEEIEKEVVAIEDLVLTAAGGAPLPGVGQIEAPSAPADLDEKASAPSIDFLEVEKPSLAEKFPTMASVKPRFSSPRLTFSLALRRLRRFVSNKWRSFRVAKELHQRSATHTTLRRMARTRRLVTSLTRLLATKSEVVTQVKKRLLTSSHATLPNGTKSDDDLDVAIYMGDVQDHILTLQHSLAHYERILSQSHPTYLSQLRTAVAFTKSGTDKAIVYLTFVSMAVLCVQTLLGTFSLNVNVPRNDRTPSGRYNVFGIVFVLCICVLSAYIYTVRGWWTQAKTKRRRRSPLGNYSERLS